MSGGGILPTAPEEELREVALSLATTTPSGRIDLCALEKLRLKQELFRRMALEYGPASGEVVHDALKESKLRHGTVGLFVPLNSR